MANGTALSRARELAELYLKAPEVRRRNTRVHFIQPLKERIMREVGYGLSLEGASAADISSNQCGAKSGPAARKSKIRMNRLKSASSTRVAQETKPDGKRRMVIHGLNDSCMRPTRDGLN